MAGDLGSLYFALGLDDKQFNDAIEKAKKKVAELTGEATITIKVDADNVKQEVQDAVKKIDGKEAEVKVGVDKHSKASVEELVEAIEKAEKQLNRLKTNEAWNTAAIERQTGFVKNLKRQLEQAKSVKVAATEAKAAVNNVAQSTQTIQHVVDEKDIATVNALEESMRKLNEQLELRNRLDQGKIDAAERNKAEREEQKRLKEEKKAAEKAAKEAARIEKEAAKEAERAAKEAAKIEKEAANAAARAAREKEAAAAKRLRDIEKESKAIQKQQLANYEAQKAYNQAARYAEVQETLNTDLIYDDPKYKAEQQRLKEYSLEEDRIAKENSAKRKKRIAEIKAGKRAEAQASNSALQKQLRELQRLEEATRRLQHLRVDLNTSDIDKDSEDFKKAAAALDRYIKKLQELQSSGKMLNSRKVTDVIGADMSNVVKRVQRVVKGGAFDSLDEDIDKTKNKAAALGSVLDNVFNYYMIERFVRNLYTIGGEFQKQQIALQSMIGDIDKANSIFERTKAMAVKSPFTFSELASYTKQMSAYGIEYENLYDTTKRLADISAGVGVDMGRLILAFGQVRSAAVLRGQELRQFTEAGIPLVNELAKKFSELENRAVSAGEVFDKISRREVSFGMVKDVLFEMTDPGGRFFEMQEELSKSLAGQWSNLKDAWEIMISEVANGTNGPLNVLASVIRGLISGWRVWLPLISGTALGITALNAGLRLTSTLVNIGFAGAAAFNPWVAGLAALAGGVGIIAGIASSIETAAEAQARLAAELETSLTELSENEKTANRYLDILSKTTDKESEKDELLRRQKATLETLRSMYGDIVKDVQLEELTTEKIFEWRKKIGELTSKESGDLLQKNVDDSLKALNDAQNELKKRQNGTKLVLSTNLQGELVKKEVRYTQAEIEEATRDVVKFEALYNEAKKRQQEYLNRQEDLAQEDLTGWREKAKELIKGTTLQAPKEDQSIKDYFNYLKEEYDAGKSEFEMYAENNPITAANKANAKALRDAANKVNIGLGGVSFLAPDKKDTKKDKAAKDAGIRTAEMFAEGVREGLSRISSQWDLYKQLFEATGDKQFAMSAFSVTPVWDEAAKQMLSQLEQAMSDAGIEDALEFNISDSMAKVLYGDFYDSWKQIKDRIEKNGIDLKVNTANAIESVQSVQDKIKSKENQRDEELKLYKEGSSEYNAVAKKWENEIVKLKGELFELSPTFKNLFIDTAGMAASKLYEMWKQTKNLVELINRNTTGEVTNSNGEKIGRYFTNATGGTDYIAEDAFKRLMDRLPSLEREVGETQIAFNRLWDSVDGEGTEGYNLSVLTKDLSTAVEYASKLAVEISGALQAMGFEGAGNTADGIGAFLGGMSKMMEATSAFAAGDNVSGFESLAAGINQTASAISTIEADKESKKIAKLRAEVKKLSNEYSELSRALERQLGGATAEQSTQMLDSLEAQKAATQKLYDEAADDKDTDPAKLEDYKAELAELDDQIKYFYEDLASEQYGVDIKEWSSQIADALTNAFAAGEDAAEAFDATVSDILRSLVTEAIKLQFIQPAMDSLRDYMFGDKGIFTKNSENGTDLSDNEAAGLGAELGKLKSQIEASNEYWDKINEAIDGILSETEASSSGLSKGIQSVTEDTADLLASYLNAVRVDVAVKRSLIEKLIAEDVPQMNYLAQAQLVQLQSIAANTLRNANAADKIYDLVNRVVDKGSNKLKV